VSFYVSTATFILLHCDEWDRVVALPRHKFVTGATLLQLVLDACDWKISNYTYCSVDKKKNSYIYFITMICAAFSIKTSFSRTNTFEIHSISTSKSLIHLIIDDIKKYCIFGTIVPLLNVKPNWEKVIYLSFILAYRVTPFLACNIHT
jgi:hypothetical protein